MQNWEFIVSLRRVAMSSTRGRVTDHDPQSIAAMRTRMSTNAWAVRRYGVSTNVSNFVRIHELREKTFRETDASTFVLCVNKIDEQYGQSISVSRLLQKSGGSNDVGKCDWLSVLSLTADWSIDCGSGCGELGVAEIGTTESQTYSNINLQNKLNKIFQTSINALWFVCL